MGFFAEFNPWLTALLSTYIGDNTARMAGALEPVIVTLGVLYVMAWGYMQLTGQVQEPFIVGMKKVITLAVILGAALHLWLYNSVIVDTFFNAPTQLGAAIVGSYDPVNAIDEIIFDGGDAANLLLEKGSFFNSNFAYYLAGIIVYGIVDFTAIYAVFLLALSRIALSVLLALGPLFIALLFFESTKKFFEGWISQLANYAFVAILTILVAALMLHLVSVSAAHAVAQGGGIQIAEAARVCMAAALTFLVMRQVMPMAAGLAAGLALSSFGIVSAAIAWGFGGALRSSGQFSRGLLGGSSNRWDPISRQAGYRLKQAASQTSRLLERPNAIRKDR